MAHPLQSCAIDAPIVSLLVNSLTHGNRSNCGAGLVILCGMRAPAAESRNRVTARDERLRIAPVLSSEWQSAAAVARRGAGAHRNRRDRTIWNVATTYRLVDDGAPNGGSASLASGDSITFGDHVSGVGPASWPDHDH